MYDEPRRHPRFLLLLAAAALGTVPLPFVGSELMLCLGLPLWLLWSLGCTALMAALTSWGLLRLWRDDDVDSGSAADSESTNERAGDSLATAQVTGEEQP